MMQVFINGKPISMADGATLADALVELKIAPRSCATAVNGLFVAREARASVTLCENDQVMTFEPITGG